MSKLPEECLGAIGLWENPTKIPAGEEKAAILLCSLRRACVLDLNLFPEGMRKASQLECVSCHPSPNTQTPFRSLRCYVWAKFSSHSFPGASAILRASERILPEYILGAGISFVSPGERLFNLQNYFKVIRRGSRILNVFNS